MHKMLVVALREYLAAVRTKTFLIGLLLMPLFMGGSLLVQYLVKDVVDIQDRKYVLVDRTGRKLAKRVQAGIDEYNRSKTTDPQTHRQVKPHFVVVEEPPSAATPEAINQQRYELSERVRKGQIVGFLEILPGQAPAAAPVILRYQSNRPATEGFPRLAESLLAEDLRQEQAKKLHLSKDDQEHLLKPAVLQSKALSRRDAEGRIEEAPEQSLVAPFLVPAGMVVLMFLVVLMAATPLMQGVVEEKMQRIAEVLLGSVQPFPLMLGKLVGMAAVSLTIAAVYLGGAYWAAHYYGFDEFISNDLLGWFLAFQVLAALMYGSLFIAVGAACTDMKETQNLLWPVMLLATMPMFFLSSVLREPNSPVATGLSFFPFATPMLMIARQAAPPGLPWWQPLLGIVMVLATTVLCVYAAGRIFRVGLLLQGKGAKLSEIAKWVFRG
jgi:ABC-2 type transport system permease protein